MKDNKEAYHMEEGRRYASRSREKMNAGGRYHHKNEHNHGGYRKSSVDNYHKRNEASNVERGRNYSRDRRDYHQHVQRQHHRENGHDANRGHSRSRTRSRSPYHHKLGRDKYYNKSPKRNLSKERNRNAAIYDDRNGERKRGDKYKYEKERGSKWDSKNGGHYEHDRYAHERYPHDRPQYDRPPYERPPYDRPPYERPPYDRPPYDRHQHERYPHDRPQYDRPPHQHHPGGPYNSHTYEYREGRDERMNMRRYSPGGDRQRYMYENESNRMGHNIGMMRRERPREMRNYFYKKADPCKIFVGNISPEAREEDVRRKFLKYGDIVNMQWKTRFAFIEYEKTSNAEIAIKEENGQLFFGEELNVQPHHAGNYFNNRSDGRNFYPPIYRRNYSPNGNEIREKKNALRIVIKNVDEKASWQDLKDFGRDIGFVNYANVVQNDKKERFGIIEYCNYENVKKAVEVLDGRKFNGITVEVMKFADSPLNMKFRGDGEDRRDGNSHHHYSGDKDRSYHREGYDAEKGDYRRERFYERSHDRHDDRDDRRDRQDDRNERNKFGRDEKEDGQHDKLDRDHRRGSINSDRRRGSSQDKGGADGVDARNKDDREDGNDLDRQSQLSGRRGNSKDKEENFGEGDRLSRKSGSSARSGSIRKDKYRSGGAGSTDGTKQTRNNRNDRSESADHLADDQRSSVKGKDKEDDYSVDKEREEAIKNDRELSTRGDDEDENMYRSDEEGSVLGSTNVRDKIEQNADGEGDRYNGSRSRSRSVSVKAKQQTRKRNTKGRRKGRRASEDSSSRRDLQDSYYNDSTNDKWAASKKVCVDKANSTESGS
ncbi:RNA binding protein [Plasmodium coatneyi]|uniref:RNA binding protein n=1 Tax=Plasmodium coatneyi TaxID=208452 RepID=A0A1B1DXZ1_9APIC|nr:RNA binding protein [Plasmodium coatneyi]ANQ07624.1 RNA binding protein [Plasmodium coatneyi]